MKNRLFQRLSAFAVAGAMAVSFAAVPVAATQVPEHEHNWVSQQTEVATCQKAGFVNYKCDCGETKTETLPQKTEHTYNAEGKCSVCAAENPELLTVADPNANNAEGTQTGGNGEQGKTNGGEGQPTENNGETQNTDSKGENTDTAKPDEGKGENTDTSKPDEGNGENTDTSKPDEGNGENTDTSKPDEGKGENTDTSKPTEGNGENTETSKPAEGNGETTETSKPTEGKDETTGSTETTEGLTEEEKAAQESAKRVAEVQALIDALPDQIRSDEVAQYQEKVAAIRAILATMTAEQVAQLTGLEKLELELTTADEDANAVVENPVAMIGKTPYATFEEAFKAFNDLPGDVTVTILAPVEFIDGMELKGSYNSITFVGEEGADARITIKQGAGGDYLESNKKVFFKNLTLDKHKANWADNSGHMGNYFSIQGGTVSYEGCKFPNGACTSGGTATYNSCQFSHTKGEYGLWVYDDAHVTVQNSTIDSAKGIKLYAEDETTVTSTLKVESTTFTENVTKKPAVAITYAASVELVGNTYRNPEGVLELDSGSDANCNGIAFTIQDSNGADISATITATDRSAKDARCGVVMDGKLYLNVKSAANAAKSGSKVAVLYNPASEGVVTFPAGTELTFPADVSKPENIVVEPSIAQVGGKHYDNVQDAVKAAAESGGEVLIGSDVALDKPLIIPAGKPVTLNLNGKTLSAGADCFKANGDDSLIVVDSGASLTVKGEGGIKSSQYGIKMTRSDKYDPNQTATLVVNGGTIEAAYFAITGNGNRDNTNITVNGGTLKGEGGIYHPQVGNLTITGGSITGSEFGVEMRAGNLKITGGSITAKAEKFEVTDNPSGSTSIGVAVAVVPHTTGKNVTVNISGGTLKGERALNEQNVKGSVGTVTMAVSDGNFEGTVASENVKKFITGGTFSEQPKEDLAKDHFSFEEKPDGTFELKEDPHITVGGDKLYPSKPGEAVSLDDVLAKNAASTAPKIDMGVDGVVNQHHTMSGNLTMEVNGHKITGTGSISGKLTLKNLNANGTYLALPQGGKATFQNGSVQVSVDAMTDAAGKSFGYSKPIQITHGGHDYTYFLAIGGSNDGKLSIDANGKPIVSGQHYVVKAKTDKIEKFTMTGIYNGSVTSNDFYKNTNATLQFVTDAPATALEVGFVTVDGKQITDSSCFSVTSGDTAAVTLSNKYLRSLSIGVHTLQMHFKDGKTVYGIFSVRTTSNADSSNPKTGDTIFLPIAVMTLSLTALAVLMPRKKKFF